MSNDITKTYKKEGVSLLFFVFFASISHSDKKN